MYAIVDIKDKQFKAQEGRYLYVPHLDAEVDETLTFDRVLLLSDGEGDVQIGTPTVEDASITARVLDQVKGDKVLVFKKKRRKRYKVKKGHRQQYTKIGIESLNINGEAAADESAADEPVEDEPAEDEPINIAASESESSSSESESAETDAETESAEDETKD